MKRSDADAIMEVFTQLADAIGERLRDHDAEINELREEIKRLKETPRMSLAQKLRTKGQA